MPSKIFSNGAQDLKNAGITNYFFEARILAQHVLGLNHSEKLLQNQPMSQAQEQKFIELIKRRINHEPLAYIINSCEFYGIEFYVSSDVLIPRSDSEILIDAILKNHNHNHKLTILDLGTGSGCLILTLLNFFINAQGIAVDTSLNAIEIARKNANTLKLQNRISFIYSNWFSNIPKGIKFDIIISNPPYIAKHEKDLMNQETSWEPQNALFADGNGLKSYESIAKQSREYLNPTGSIYVEIGFKQLKQVEAIFINNQFNKIAEYQDLQGHNRCIQFSA